MSAALGNLNADAQADLTQRYQGLMRHYGMDGAPEPRLPRLRGAGDDRHACRVTVELLALAQERACEVELAGAEDEDTDFGSASPATLAKALS